MSRYRPPDVKCAGRTKSDKPCQRAPMRGQRFCRVHLEVEGAPLGTDVEIARQVAEAGYVPRVRQGLEVLHPRTGEILELGTISQTGLHALLVELHDFREAVLEAVRMVEREVTHRMDTVATWTMETDWGRLSSKSPAKLRQVADPLALRKALMEAGYEEAVADTAVRRKEKVSYELMQRGLNALMKVEPARTVIERHVVWVDPPHRRVELDTKRR